MSFPLNFDFDRFVRWVLEDVAAALSGWVRGRPTDETALLNRLTERLTLRREGCDVGLTSRVQLLPEAVILHRKGVQQVDRFGADLAVTLFTPLSRFGKTAFFQLKKSTGFSAHLERSQLNEALVEPRIAKRSFVLAVDEEHLGIRVAKVEKLIRLIPARAKSHKFRCTEWSFLTNWLWRWLSCEEAPSSDFTSGNAVERVLESFVLATDARETLWGRSGAEELPEGYRPARVWLGVAFDEQEMLEELFAPAPERQSNRETE